jgi:heavy metal sensor kinase
MNLFSTHGAGRAMSLAPMRTFVFSSVRLRRTAWYVGALSVVLIAFSIGVYTLLARSARNDLDRELAGSIDVLSRSLRHEIDEHEGKLAGEESFVTQVLSTVYRDSFPGIAIGVYDGSRLVGSKPGPNGFIPPQPISVERDLTFASVQKDSSPWRAATQTVSAEAAGQYQFVSTASLERVEADLANLRSVFYLTIPLALAFAAVGGFLLARQSLAPVVAMSETADQISSKDLSQRLKVGNPKDELGRLAATLNLLLSRLEGSFAQQRQFMADSSHELRTPIYVAHTAAQVMLEHDGRPEQDYREALTTIDQQLKRIQHLVEDMFLLARADSGAYPLQIAAFDLGETINETVRAARLLALRRGVSVTGPEFAELACHGDEQLIRQLLMILVDNAIKFTPDGGRVALEVDQHDPQLYSITVQDTGLGIPEEAQPHIFDRFYRADGARSQATNGGGAGLGLAIAKWITEIHGGGLTLQHSGPGGSTFVARIQRRGSSSLERRK